MRRAILVLFAAALIALVGAGAARAASSPTPWDGTDPFNCVLQQAGFGPTGPDPGADPYCVQFDKTHQNVAQLGLVDFLANEPARTAAASPKCFYFQVDHWRGSISQDDPSTETYEWIGHYFFNKATGDGGVWVTDFNLHGQTMDPRQLPGFPPDWGPYFGPGTGGFITHDDVPAEPSCAAQAAQHPSQVYAPSGPPPSRCVDPGRAVTRRRLGPLGVGETEGAARRALGPPYWVRRGFLLWCATGGGELRAGELSDRSGDLGSDPGARLVVLVTTSPRVRLGGIDVGSTARRFHRRLPRARRVGRSGALTVWAVRRGSPVLVVVAHGRVRELAVYQRGALQSRRSLVRLIARAG